MTYLVNDFRGLHEVEEKELKQYLLEACAYWSVSLKEDDPYKDYMYAYTECMKDCYFGSIAQVYKITCMSLYSMEKDVPTKIIRIY